MESKLSVTTERNILQDLDDLEQGSKLIWIVLFVSISVSLLNGFHTMSYIFVAEVPEHWCSIPELEKFNWTAEQIKNISEVDECHIYNFNYKDLAGFKYEDAVKYVEDMKFNTSVIPCSSFVFDKNGRSTIVNEWQLVCDKKIYRANTFLAYAFGKLMGDGILGIYSDKYGRKQAMIVSLILQAISVPASAFIPWYWAYFGFKFMTGMSISSMYSCAYTILSEVTKNKKKNLFGAIIDSMFSIGTLLLIGIAYFLTNWRYLQLALSFFTLITIILVWFLPESPRWLLSQSRHEEAQKIVEKYSKTSKTTALIPASSNLSSSLSENEDTKKKGLKKCFGKTKILFADSILRKKILIMYYLFFITLSVGYCLIFNIDTFDTNRYIYTAITATVDLIAIILVLITLLYLSCQKACAIINTIVAICMLSIVAVPREHVYIVMALTFISKFCLMANFTVSMLLASELFPTSVRNSALGSSLLMAQLGSMSSPYIVDFLGNVAWFAPTTLCGILTLIAAFLCLLIPS
ncbi:organic cation transporter protein-like [Cotesia glomerata]|uniref:Major facilitator superfamily (MFS) profile domain-containing protein n=1 Tax=Cotesia glomerata TaxID=32391 RepID=A0AAV7J741_COTGL|nr:organic cation transporter protein-like [Cotesia glomerata]KAH0568650.1 hypothetical protein KQX54_021338 [Cotesia glomerata]